MKTISLLTLMFTLACGSAAPVEETTPEPLPEPEPVAVVAPPTPEPEVRVEGDHIRFDRHILFDLDSDVILPVSNDLLDAIGQVITEHPEITHLSLIGHTDAQGGAAHNQRLSNRRAAAVVAALQSRGITITLDASGVGSTQHVCPDSTEACHAQNRRVEFLIVDDGAEESAPGA